MTIDEAEMELVKFLEDKVGNIGNLEWNNINLVEFGMLKDAESLEQQITDDYLLQEEEIYYHRAMEYLSKEDPTLEESLSIAEEFGTQTKDLNSCLLASFLATRRNEEEFSENFDRDAIQEKIDELNAQIEGEDE